MNRGLTRWPLALYPRAWRDRYGAEVTSLTDELVSAGDTTPLRAGLNLIAGAAVARAHAMRPRRAVLAPVIVAITALAGSTLDITRTQPSGGAMRPYFATHPIGMLLVAVALLWFVIELVGLVHVRQSAPRPSRAGNGMAGIWLVYGICVIAMNTVLYLAPPIVPVAAIRPEDVAADIGMVVLLAGAGLRLWSFKTLGRYFAMRGLADPDQPVVSWGPYRIVRHPASAGILLISIGVGLMSGNWVGLAAMVLLLLAVVVWHIRREENALLTAVGDSYRYYSAQHQRLIPLVW